LSDEFESGGTTSKPSSISLWESVSSDKRGIDGLKLAAESELGSITVNDKLELGAADTAVLFSERLHGSWDEAVTGILGYDCEVTDRAG
jgi:hypothetical protein